MIKDFDRFEVFIKNIWAAAPTGDPMDEQVSKVATKLYYKRGKILYMYSISRES